MSKIISIIVPIYKVEKYLDRCINSILNQTFKDFELILVDDGSPDRCGDICEEYAKKDKRIKVIHKENGGLSDARNAGLDIATGKFIGFIDSDDFIHKDMYMILYDAIIKSKSDISQCKFKYFSKEDELNKNIINDGKYEIYNNIDAIEEIIDNKNLNTNVWNKLYKRELFNDIRFPKGKIHEDEFVTYKVFYRAKTVSYVNKELYYYFSNDTGIMKNLNINSKFDWIEAIEERNEFLLSIKEKSLFNKSNSYLFFNLIKLRYNIKKSEELKNKSQMYNLVNEKIKYSLNAISDKSSYSKLNKIVVSLMKLNFNFVVFYDFYNYKRAK
ncbi:glycosyltransferase family 2 protein [Clostridium sp.]|uniref:glycosyltransferase family 2 protein n=1 Tax=Clostridium sp. TaxID=1506 RepID=UPI003521AA6C